MKPEQAKRWITDSRLDPYLAEVGGEHERAVALYVWNASVSAAMFETLHHVEVAVRNTIDAQFEPVLASAEPPAMWLCDPAILNERSLQLVDETIGKGHLVMFAFRPYWRWQTQGTFAMGFNAIMNWDHLDAK